MKDVPADRARPKSRIFNVQSLRTTILLGFKSYGKYSRRNDVTVNASWMNSIWRLTYSMNNSGEMKVLDATQHLVQEVGHSLVVQIHVDHLAQIRVHQLHHDVQIEELLERLLRRERV